MRRLYFAFHLVFLFASQPLPAQMFEQVYPDFEVARILDGTQWNGDTVFLCGLNQMLLRSSDAGMSWTNVMQGVRDWCFYKIAATSEAMFLLSEPTVFWPGTLPEGQLSMLLRYDPRNASLDLVQIPRMPASGSRRTSLYDLVTDGEAMFLLQGNREDGLMLHRSMDEARSWKKIALPDSLFGSQAYVFCYDSTHFAVVSPVASKHYTWYAHLTADGGQTWTHDPALPLEKAGLTWLSENEVVAIMHEGPIMYSSDGGESWTQQSWSPSSLIHQIVGFQNGRGYILGDFGEMFRTDDAFRTFIDISHGGNGESLIPSGVDTLVVVGHDNDHIYLSHDGGLTWEYLRKARYRFWELRMASDTVGVAMVQDYHEGTYAYYHTKNGWRSMDLVMDESDPVFPKYYVGARMYPVTESLWYIVHPIRPDNGWLVHRSTNSGESWEDILSVNDLGGIPTEGSFTVVDIADTSCFGIILGQNLVTTTDLGETWAVKELPGPFDHAYIAKLRPHASSWLVVRKGREERDTLWYCKTGWDQWEAILAEPDTVGLGSNFRTLEVSTAGEVLLLAEFDSNLGYTYDWSYIYRSSDDGRNWELYPMSIKRSGVYYLEDGTGIVLEMVRQAQESKTFGTGLFRSADGWKNHHLEDVFYPTLVNQIATAGRSIYPNAHNAIYRNSTNGINSIIESPTYLPGVKIMTPYPHPIRRGALVTLPLQVSGAERMLHVTVHDVLGRELCLLYDARVSGGRISIPWRVDNLVPGLYILRIQYGDVSVVKPVVVE